MARRRMIDPLIWEDFHFGRLRDRAKLLFIACISNADDQGRLIGEPENLRAIAFRYSDVGVGEIRDLVEEVSRTMRNFMTYEVGGCQYIQLGKWETYQAQRDDRRKASTIPACPQDDDMMSTESQPDVGVSKEVKLSKLSEVSKKTTVSLIKELIGRKYNSNPESDFVRNYFDEKLATLRCDESITSPIALLYDRAKKGTI